jgi:hypothetical protein
MRREAGAPIAGNGSEEQAVQARQALTHRHAHERPADCLQPAPAAFPHLASGGNTL